MRDQFWKHTTDLAAWACAAARSAVDGLDIGSARAGYRHVVNTTLDGVVTHELVEIASGLTVYVCYRRPSGESISGFCQPWPPVLLRFVEAVLLRGLLPEVGAISPTSDRDTSATEQHTKVPTVVPVAGDA